MDFWWFKIHYCALSPGYWATKQSYYSGNTWDNHQHFCIHWLFLSILCQPEIVKMSVQSWYKFCIVAIHGQRLVSGAGDWVKWEDVFNVLLWLESVVCVPVITGQTVSVITPVLWRQLEDRTMFCLPCPASRVCVSIQSILGFITENYHGLDTQHRLTRSQLIIANFCIQPSMKL